LDYHDPPLVIWLHANQWRTQIYKSATFTHFTFRPPWPWPWPTVAYYSSTSTYIPNFVQIRKLSVDGRTDTETCFVRL